MRVAIDAHAVGKRQTGNEVYIRGLMEHYQALAPDIEFLAYVSSTQAARTIPPSILSRPISSNPYVRLGLQLGRRLQDDRASLLHVQYTAPLHCPVPLVVTVHDVSFVEQPEFFSLLRQRQLALTVRRTVKQAARVLTCSAFSQRAISRTYGMDPDRIVVAPNAASQDFRPLSRERARDLVRQELGFDAPYLLCVGNLQRRKNQIGLIRAFESLMRDQPQWEQHLVFVGKETTQSAEILAAAKRSPLRQRIHFTGFVADDLLPWLYNGCDLFVFPSFYEGFGIPLLEAMACGCPVVCSNRTALPEVGGNAAVYFDPGSVSAMAQTLHDMLRNLDFATKLRRAAIERAGGFSWRRSAGIVLDTYREAAGLPAPVRVPAEPRAFASGS